MSSFARPHSGAPLPLPSPPPSLSTSSTPSPSPSPSPSTPYHRHRRHYSSVAKDYRDFLDSSPASDQHTPDKRAGQDRPASTQRQSVRISVASATSMASGTSTSTSSTSTTSTVRRFWAPSPSPPPSPPSFSSFSASPTLLDGASATTATVANHTRTSPHTVTYIPPLVDAASGTLSRRQLQSHGSALSPVKLKYWAADLQWLATATPELLLLASKQVTTPLLAGFSAMRTPLALSLDGIADAAEALLQIWLATIQVGTIAAAPILFLCLPGILFSVWLAACLLCISASSWPLNSGTCCTGSVFHPPWGADSIANAGSGCDGDDDDSNDDNSRPKLSGHWFFVCGMGATSRALSKTGPRLAGVFGHPITLVRPHTYGAVADLFLSAILPRLWDQQLSHTDALYDMLYPILTTPSSHTAQAWPPQIVVLAHNTGATAVSQVLARLIVDVPAQRLSQLEIYTFGSLAADFVLPRASGPEGSRTPPPHIEHIAHVHDPCARFGVLRSIREDLAGRYCGSAFVLGEARKVAQSGRPAPRTPSASTAPTQEPTVKARERCRMSFPFTIQQQQQQKQQQQQLLQLRYLQQQRNAFLDTPYLARTTSSSSTDSAVLAPAHTRPPFSPSPGGLYPDAMFFGRQSKLAQPTMLSMEDYLTELFGPEPWSMRPGLVDIDSEFVDMNMNMGGHRYHKAGSLPSDAPFLDAEIVVDRELAEQREMAAIEAAGRQQPSKNSSYSIMTSFNRLSSKDAHHRLSWTGLGATAKFGTARAGTSIKALPGISATARTKLNRPADAVSNSRLEGLEAVRRLCREYDGRPGREVSVLAGYFSEAVVRHRKMFGF